MDNSIGPKGILWGSIGAELLAVVFDLRYMVLCSLALILADLWWGYRSARMHYDHAKDIGNETLMEKYKWHKSRAVRRTANKFVDYMTYLVVGALIGLAITEPMDLCTHVWTAAIGLGIGCGCEIASIVGHVMYVHMGIEISTVDAWRAIVRFVGRLIKVKSGEFGEAVEDLGRKDRHHHGQELPDRGDGSDD